MEKASILDVNVAEAIASYISDGNNYEDYLEAREREELSMTEWVYNYRLGKFDAFCQSNYGYKIIECI